MLVTTFAAIHIGTYEINLEIFEITKKYGIRSINTVRHRMELGKDTYLYGKISPVLQDELCRVLKDFVRIMNEYQVSDYRLVATSSFRESSNSLFVIAKIKQMTSLAVEVLSNSEQRFLGYKAIASMEKSFNKLIEKGTAIIDLDGGSFQISLFDKDALVTTQNIKMGNLRVREMLGTVSKETTHYEMLVEELLHGELTAFRRMFLKDRKIENIMLIGDFFTDTLFQTSDDSEAQTITREGFKKWYKSIIGQSDNELAVKLSIPQEYASLLQPTIIIYKILIDLMGAELLWTPGTHINRGLAYEYAENKKLIKLGHDFENDIVMSAKNIGKRFMIDSPHAEATKGAALVIYDAMKKLHGMNARDRLLLEISSMLLDVGKYISLNYVGESGYNMLMANEIIGLSHRERKLIALVIRAVNTNLAPYEELFSEEGIVKSDYLKAAAFTTILSMAANLDRSSMQKVVSITAALKERRLKLKLDVNGDFTLEEGMLEQNKADFFERFGIEVDLRTRRIE